MDYALIKRMANVFHLLANYMDSYSGDLFIDFPRACDIASCGRNPIVFMHKTHADLSERYESILREENKPSDFEDCVKKCQQTLGLNFAIEIGEETITIVNYKLGDWELRDLITRIHDIPEYRLGDSVAVVSKKSEEVA